MAGGWPIGTFLVNVAGCLLMGVVFAWVEARSPSPFVRLLLMTGFLGAFTTFSTYELEAWTLLREGMLLKAALYVLGSLIIGLFALIAAYHGTRALFGNL